MSMTDYVIELEHLYHRMTNHEMPLPNTVWTFKLLDGVKLNDDEIKLALTLGNNLEFETMKSALKWFFIKSTAANESFYDTNNIKQKEVFYSKYIYTYISFNLYIYIYIYKLKENKAPKSLKF